MSPCCPTLHSYLLCLLAVLLSIFTYSVSWLSYSSFLSGQIPNYCWGSSSTQRLQYILIFTFFVSKLSYSSYLPFMCLGFPTISISLLCHLAVLLSIFTYYISWLSYFPHLPIMSPSCPTLNIYLLYLLAVLLSIFTYYVS